MAPLSNLPTRLENLSSDIKTKERSLSSLRNTERRTYKTYVRARRKLASKKYHNVQNPRTKKWYKLWVKSVDELQALTDLLEREESDLVDLKQRRAEWVALDRGAFERELLAR